MIVCKSPGEIEKMRASNVLVAEVLAQLAAMVVPGVTTQELDTAAERDHRIARSPFARLALPRHRVEPPDLLARPRIERAHVTGRIALVGESIANSIP